MVNVSQAEVEAAWRGLGLISLLRMYVKNCPGNSSNRAWTTEICPPVQTATNLLDETQCRSLGQIKNKYKKLNK